MGSVGQDRTVVFAGGGTAGHVEPALATADALRALHPQWSLRFLGTSMGIEARLVPARGYSLEFIPRVPMPRRASMDLLRLPLRLLRAVRQADAVIKDADCVVGFGGYVSMPAYLAARRRRIPIVVHEQNARAGIANRIGGRWALARTSTFSGALTSEQVIGLPLRPAIAAMADRLQADRAGVKARAREALGLAADRRVLVVTGGSQGSARINSAIQSALPALLASGWEVLHAVGERNQLPLPQPGYHPTVYLEQIELALAAADLLIGRAGAGTVVESAALGVPAIFIPLPIGNGEQELNARDLVRTGGAVLIPDAECDGDRLMATVASCSTRLEQMRSALAGQAHIGAAERLAARIAMIVMENPGS